MNHSLRLTLARWAAAVALLSPAAGCGPSGGARFVPDAEVARASLQTALSAWRDGKPCGPIAGDPPIQVADSEWQNGLQIASFQIGDEGPEIDGTKQFPVTLTLKKDGKSRDVRYMVHGRDPVWIYSEADYKRMIDMGNGTEPAKTGKTARSRGR
jgi:hypothetical protein